jgi:hypothetical protein
MNKKELNEIKEQIQQDLLTYLDGMDNEILDKVCKIVVNNFKKISNTKKIKFLILGSLFLTSCGMGQLTTQQQQEIIKIDKQLDDLWNEHNYKIDSLWIEKQKVINQKNK